MIYLSVVVYTLFEYKDVSPKSLEAKKENNTKINAKNIEEAISEVW